MELSICSYCKYSDNCGRFDELYQFFRILQEDGYQLPNFDIVVRCKDYVHVEKAEVPQHMLPQILNRWFDG